MKNITPYTNESEAIAIGELNIENREDRITVYGSVELTRDKAGLQKAKALKAILDAVVAKLSGESLPDQISIKPTGTIKNPF